MTQTQAGQAPAGDTADPEDTAGPEDTVASRGAAGAGRIAGAGLARQVWPTVLGAAAAMIAIGILLLAWPRATLAIVAVLIGAALVVAGLFRLADGIMTRGESGGMRAADVVVGLLAIAAGLLCLRHQALTLLALALVAGVFWIIHGVSDLVLTVSATALPGRGLRAVGGFASIVAGLAILFWPGLSLIVLLTVLGVWLLVYGCVLAGLAFRLRSHARQASGPRHLVTA